MFQKILLLQVYHDLSEIPFLVAYVKLFVDGIVGEVQASLFTGFSNSCEVFDRRGPYILQVQFSVFIDELINFDPSEFIIIVCRDSFCFLECFDCLFALPSLLSNEKLSELGFLFSPVDIRKNLEMFKLL